ncbi:MAG TPA: hypothetical protein VFL13_16270 [Candidatus Baltobacteraceae bacterium]|nr:hypothetical protein [Candidatus Baltobacteraceae bacterium]
MLEILNTAAAIGTFVVITATAVAAVFQLRHMRAANQLQGLLTVLARVEDSGINAWFTETQRQLPGMLSDPEYVRSLLDFTFDRNVAWLQLGNSYDWIGSLVKNGLISESAFLDVYTFRVIQAWELLKPIVVIGRRNATAALWDSFEYLFVRAQQWRTQYPEGTYPEGVERAPLPAFEEILPNLR